MKKNNLINQLKNLRHGEVSPRPEWVAGNRNLLLSQITNTLPQANSEIVPMFERVWPALSLFLPRQFVYNVVRPIGVLVLVSLLGLSGWVATSSASNEALPGDTLYPVKIALEKTKVALAETVGNGNVRTQAHITYSQNRVTEIKRLKDTADPKKDFHIAEAVSNLKEGVEHINDSLNKDLSGDTIKDAKENTDQVKSTLQEVSSNLASASSTNVDLSKEITATTNLAKDTAVKAIEIFVTKVDDQSVSPEAAKSVLNDAISSIVTDVDNSKQNVTLVKNIAQAAEAGVKDFQAVIRKQNSSTTAETEKISKELSSAASQATAAATTIEIKSVEVNKKITQAQELVNSDQLSAAVDKIKEVNNDSKNIIAETDVAIKKANGVLPVTPLIKEAVAGAVGAKDIQVIVSTSTVDSAQAPQVPVVTIMVSGTVSATKTLVPSSTTVIDSALFKK